MQKPTCSIDDCEKPMVARGWCPKHWMRWRHHGDPHFVTDRTTPLPVRFWAKVQKTPTCWNWTASKDKDGYGHFLTKRNGKSYADVAHRVVYEMTYGSIPEGKKIDHRCHNRACVNPSHLRLTTHKENLENRAGAQRNNLSCGVRGVTWHTRIGKWRGYVRHNKEDYHVGYFEDLAEAEAAVIAKRNELFTHNDVDRLSRAELTA